MAIRVLHTEWADGWGGQEIRILQEMLAMRELGVEVFMACTSHSNINKYARENNIPTFNFRFGGNTDFKTMWGLRKLIKKEKIDIVNTHSGKDTLVGGIAAKLSRVKFIRTRHLSGLTKKTSVMNHLADYIFTTGESVRKNMINHTGIKSHKIMSIPTGVDPERFDPDKFDREAQRLKLGIASDEIAIGMVAVLRGWKRHDRMLKCCKILVDQGYNIKIILAGDGPAKECVKQYMKDFCLEDRVVMLGHVKHPEEVFPALDFVLSCSDGHEGVSQSVMQALLMNKMVLATNIGSVADLLSDNNFILTKNGAVEDWAQKLKELIDSPRLKASYEAKARGFVLDNFSKPVMANKIINIYKHLLQIKD